MSTAPPNAVARKTRSKGSAAAGSTRPATASRSGMRPGAQVLDNDIRYGRDGIFTITSKSNLFSGNRFRDLRFAVHYMYTNDSEVSGNVSIGNTVGYAIMYSHRLTMHGNISDGDRDHGLLFNYANGSEISGNRVRGRLQSGDRAGRAPACATRKRASTDCPTRRERRSPTGARIGPEKCVFIYNANKNRFRDNWFERCDIGVHFTAGSEGNEITGNAFVGNRNQVKYVGTRYLDWSKDGRGNYWSDNPAFDLDGDGIADSRLPAERSGRPGAVDRAARQGADQQPRGAGAALGAEPVSRASCRAASSTAIR